MARVVVIEDDRDLLQLLDHNLRKAGHQVQTATAGGEGLALVKQHAPDLVLLDVMLPDLPGTEVCRAIKADAATSAVPVVMLTARGEEIDRIVGFELGADDYVTKPFSTRELLLRIQAILRRGAAVDEEAAAQQVEFGLLRVDRAAHRLWVDGTEVALTTLELKLLLTLYDRRDRVQSRGRLLSDVWGISADVNTRTVDTHVKRLREKLGAAGKYVETVRGVGYRFAGAPRSQD